MLPHSLSVTVAALAVSALLIGPAAAQLQRNFPQTALRGALVIGDTPEVLLNGKPGRLAPGARIRNTSNMLSLPGTLTGNRLLVNYTLDLHDQVQDVWILTPDEAARRPWPTTRKQADEWLFDPTSQTWSRP